MYSTDIRRTSAPAFHETVILIVEAKQEHYKLMLLLVAVTMIVMVVVTFEMMVCQLVCIT